MTLLASVDLAAVTAGLRALDVDGWLLYDFRGGNPVAGRIIGLEGMATRRLFVWLPVDGPPVAVAHQIELQGVKEFPGEVRPYAGWRVLHEELARVVRGKRVAMEISAMDAVPYLDWVPHGVVQLIEHLGGEVCSSSDLVSAFAARLTEGEIAGHMASAEIIADIARRTLAEVIHEVGTAREHAVQQRVLTAIDRGGLTTSHPPIVAFGANAANPHYEPHEGSDAVLEPDQVVLLDLWGGQGDVSVYADQTWMAFAGGAPPDEVTRVWEVVRDARDAVVDYAVAAAGRGETVRGADLDDQARGVITEAGYGEAFVHRTGHSIDVELHGCGPHLDNFETHDIREITPGLAFSVEPGVYLTGRFGVRSEINVIMGSDGPRPTPREPQRDLFLP